MNSHFGQHVTSTDYLLLALVSISCCKWHCECLEASMIRTVCLLFFKLVYSKLAHLPDTAYLCYTQSPILAHAQSSNSSNAIHYSQSHFHLGETYIYNAYMKNEIEKWLICKYIKFVSKDRVQTLSSGRAHCNRHFLYSELGLQSIYRANS